MTKTDLYLQERQQLAEATDRLFASGVMSNSGHINLSVPIEDGVILAGSADVNAMTVVHGEDPESEINPSMAEIIRMHTEVYLVRPDVKSIIHTHSPKLLAFAMANVALPDRYEALLRFGQAEEVPVVPWAPRGSDRSVKGIVELVQERPTTKAVLLGNHGVLVFGSQLSGMPMSAPMAAAMLLITMEEAAGAELLAKPALGGAKDFPAGALEETRESIARGQEIARSSAR